MSKRLEKDSLGEVEVPSEAYWGAQTERSLHNFPIGEEKMPLEVVKAFAIVKKAAATVNTLPKDKKTLITEVCDEILAGKLDDQFPLSVWQTGSGTQTNMNLNEVISNRANEKAGSEKGTKKPIHPNDDVNQSQSSNDTFPTAMHIAALQMLHGELFPSIDLFQKALVKQAKEFDHIIKVGRTHLMDATPLTLGQEFSGYAAQILHAKQALERVLPDLNQIALGATAVGTGINAPKGFKESVAAEIANLTKLPIVPAENSFESLACHDPFVSLSGSLKRLACALLKIANDIRWMGSGPRCGLGELKLPENEPGSSIMPGKVNPTQCEAMAMVCAKVMGNDVTISVAASQGNFELNVNKPVIIYSTLQSIRLLSDAMRSFNDRCLVGIKPNAERINELMQSSLMLATALNREIGYDAASKIVRKAHSEGTTLKESALSLGLLSEAEFDKVVDPTQMVGR